MLDKISKQPVLSIDNQEVVDFRPKLGGKAAIVDLVTVKRIISHLQITNLSDIKKSLIDRIVVAKDMKGLVTLLDKELTFHQTCNLITMYKSEDEQLDEKLDKEQIIADAIHNV